MTSLRIKPGALARSIAQVHPDFRWAWQGNFCAIPLAEGPPFYSLGTCPLPPLVNTTSNTPPASTAWEFGAVREWDGASAQLLATTSAFTGYGDSHLFTCQSNESWGYAQLWEQDSTSGDERTVFARWDNTTQVGQGRQFIIRNDNEAAPADFAALIANSDPAQTVRLTGVINTDTPYFAAAFCRGDKKLGLRLYDGLTAELLGSGLTGTLSSDTANPAASEIYVGGKKGTSDNFDGRIGVIYLWDGYAPTDAEFDQLARNPFGPIRLYRRISIMVPYEAPAEGPAGAAVLDQFGFLWRLDDDVEDAATAAKPENEFIVTEQGVTTKRRLRIGVKNTGGAIDSELRLQLRKKGYSERIIIRR